MKEAMLPSGLQSDPQFAAAVVILRKLRAEGHQAYLAGGCVRDLLLGRQPKDYDVATSATPDIVLDLFPRTFAVGAHFGVVLVSAEFDSQPTLTEVATFRSDGAYSDGRHPDAVRYSTSAEEDVQRRDFTINGLLLDLKTNAGAPGLAGRGPQRQVFVAGVAQARDAGAPGLDFETWDATDLRRFVLDYVGGLADLDAGVLRAIGQPESRFEEDHLRMLRAIRFAARFGFEIAPATHSAIRSLAHKIETVSRERVRDELTRMLTEGQARSAFELLDQTNLLAQVLPEASRLKGIEQPPQYHPEGDVWTHTLMLLAQLESGTPMTLAWGALLHDIGKPATFQPAQGPGDRIRFNGHVEVGVAVAAEICRRLRFSNDEATQILALVENHMRFADTPRMKAATLKRFFRLDRFPEHLALHRMDCLASSGNLDHYNYARERYESTPAEEVRPTPLLTGRELIAAGYQPGASFKTMLHAVEEAQLEGSIQTPEEALALVHKQFPR
jgi:putative nucleotidyltransferase with HDIG domain